ncbi:MAG TPA: T9SS type A sorting domain-containing protein, partial [Bacteroidales bacterium]|nr:T9SS type A sorting domain-containing protein [Bacteroidales bacterium]
PERLGYGLYRIQTDIMMHKLLSDKYLLMIVDGLYPGENALAVPDKWQMPPFNDDWASSLFFSLDPVAIEAVCHDFLRSEYYGSTYAENRPNWNGVDDYLQQAADSSLWPEGVVYDPDGDGVLHASLGVHEHWNDSLQKQYTRNLHAGEGIELIKGHDNTLAVAEFSAPFNLQIYPNPVTNRLVVSNHNTHKLTYQLMNSNGKVLNNGLIHPKETNYVDMQHYAKGLYFLSVKTVNRSKAIKIIKK